jgi:hypothetical protein
MICARCDQPILPGQRSQTYPVDSGSAAGADVTVHAELCEMPDHQTAPRLTRSQVMTAEYRARRGSVSRYAP